MCSRSIEYVGTYALIYQHTILGERIVSRDGLPRGVLPSGILKMRNKCPGLKVPCSLYSSKIDIWFVRYEPCVCVISYESYDIKVVWAPLSHIRTIIFTSWQISSSIRVHISFDFIWLNYKFLFVTLLRLKYFDLLVLTQSATPKSELLADSWVLHRIFFLKLVLLVYLSMSILTLAWIFLRVIVAWIWAFF